MSERQGIEIDYCPDCRGVWLDRGELDKIIDRSLQDTGGRVTPPNTSGGYAGRQQSQYDRPQGGHYKKRKREGFLSELFDFD